MPPTVAAETDNLHERFWLYLPERPGILIPANALRLEFQGDYLKSHGYRPIVLGQEL